MTTPAACQLPSRDTITVDLGDFAAGSTDRQNNNVGMDMAPANIYDEQFSWYLSEFMVDPLPW